MFAPQTTAYQLNKPTQQGCINGIAIIHSWNSLVDASTDQFRIAERNSELFKSRILRKSNSLSSDYIHRF